MVVLQFPQKRVRHHPPPDLPIVLSLVVFSRTVLSLYFTTWIFWDAVLHEMEDRFRAR